MFTRTTLLAFLAISTLSAAASADEASPWTGFYLGGHAGYALSNVDAESVGYTIFGKHGESTDLEPQGFIGGGHFGLNQAFGPVVIGLEGSISGGSLESTDFSSVGRVETQIDWIGLLTARAGYTFGNVLVYGRGGYALGQVRMTGSLGKLGDESTEGHSGYTVGGGAELLLTRDWVAGLEYNYVHLQEQAHVTNYGKVDVDANLHTVGARLSYMFGP
jgi:opacity protein-like surface antigen